MLADVIERVRVAANVHDIRIGLLQKMHGCAIRGCAVRRRAETNCGLGLHAK